jgi:hypothetical protein
MNGFFVLALVFGCWRLWFGALPMELLALSSMQ